MTKLLKNTPTEIKVGIRKITELIGFMKSKIKLVITTNKDLAKGINIIRGTGDILKKTSLPLKVRLLRRALFQD